MTSRRTSGRTFATSACAFPRRIACWSEVVPRALHGPHWHHRIPSGGQKSKIWISGRVWRYATRSSITNFTASAFAVQKPRLWAGLRFPFSSIPNHSGC